MAEDNPDFDSNVVVDLEQHRLGRETGGGPLGGGGGSDMEARIAKLEAHVEHIQKDVSELKTDIRDFRKEAKGEFGSLGGKLDTQLKWVIGLLAGVMLTALGLVLRAAGVF